jgi:hypothetical protein
VIGILLELGLERLVFAADYPFEEMHDGAGWMDALPVSDRDRELIRPARTSSGCSSSENRLPRQREGHGTTVAQGGVSQGSVTVPHPCVA